MMLNAVQAHRTRCTPNLPQGPRHPKPELGRPTAAFACRNILKKSVDAENAKVYLCGRCGKNVLPHNQY